MMLIITNKDPYKNAKYIAEHTNKNFLFKSLLELGQLVCSCGISSTFEKLIEGKKYKIGYLRISYGCIDTITNYFSHV